MFLWYLGGSPLNKVLVSAVDTQRAGGSEHFLQHGLTFPETLQHVNDAQEAQDLGSPGMGWSPLSETLWCMPLSGSGVPSLVFPESG